MSVLAKEIAEALLELRSMPKELFMEGATSRIDQKLSGVREAIRPFVRKYHNEALAMAHPASIHYRAIARLNDSVKIDNVPAVEDK